MGWGWGRGAAGLQKSFSKLSVIITQGNHTGPRFAWKIFRAGRACKQWVVNQRIGAPPKVTGKFPSGPGADTRGERLRMVPWMGGKIEAAKAQLDGMKIKRRNNETDVWNPQAGWLAGRKGTSDHIFALPPGRKALQMEKFPRPVRSESTSSPSSQKQGGGVR